MFYLSYEIPCVDKLFWFKYATVGLSNKLFFGTPTTTSKINYIHLTTVITIKPYIKMTGNRTLVSFFDVIRYIDYTSYKI